ncbi:MAG: hypothetical protein K0R31_734 [Clostridiales bacterium]|nr:hypothetical protein [Clostridiales bacterium]
MKNMNRIASAVLFLFGIYIIIGSLNLDYMDKFTPGPGFLPLWTGIIIALLAIVIAAMTFTKRTDNRPSQFSKKDIPDFSIIIGGSIVVLIATPFVGLAVALGIMSGGMARLWGEKNWVKVVALAILTPVLLHLIFAVGLGVPMPMGLFEGLGG